MIPQAVFEDKSLDWAARFILLYLDHHKERSLNAAQEDFAQFPAGAKVYEVALQRLVGNKVVSLAYSRLTLSKEVTLGRNKNTPVEWLQTYRKEYAVKFGKRPKNDSRDFIQVRNLHRRLESCPQKFVALLKETFLHCQNVGRPASLLETLNYLDYKERLGKSPLTK